MSKLWTVVLVFLAVAIWQIAGPYYTVYQIRQAVEQQDAVKLAKYVNFIQLKQNLKAQLQAKLKRRLEQQNGSFFGMLAITTTEKTLDNVLDNTVNPSTILLYMKGKRPFERKLEAIGGWSARQINSENMTVAVDQAVMNQSSTLQAASQDAQTQAVDHLPASNSNQNPGLSSSPAAPHKVAKKWSTSFDGVSKFSVLQQRANGTEIRYLLTRSGAGWQLSNIMLPVH